VRAAWLSSAVALIVGMLANTSRAAQAIGLFLTLSLVLMSIRHVRRTISEAEKLPLAIGVCVALLTILAVAYASRLDEPVKRWAVIGENLSSGDRWDSVQTAWPGTAEAGWFGFGPGTFRSIFPHYIEAPGSKVEGGWRFLHQDYVQTILEWGWAGSVLWGLLFFGGMFVAFRAMRTSSKNWLPRQRMLLPLSLLALASVALHALVDFPLQIASIQLYVATYLGICWGSGRWGDLRVESRK